MKKKICLNQSVLDFMESLLTPDSFVLELGAGWSSRWFADRCGYLLSVETSPQWASMVRFDLRDSACKWNVVKGSDKSITAAAGKANLVLVDSVANLREQYVKTVWPLLKRGCWLVFDDAQRPIHADAIEYLNGFSNPIILGWDAEHDVPAAKERVAMAWQKCSF